MFAKLSKKNCLVIINKKNRPKHEQSEFFDLSNRFPNDQKKTPNFKQSFLFK